MSDFLKSSPAIDVAVNESTNFEEMREKMLASLAAQGTVVRDRADAYGVRLLRQPEPEPDVSLPANPAQDTCMRVIYLGNDRYEFCGVSETALDAKEAAIRAMFSGQR